MFKGLLYMVVSKISFVSVIMYLSELLIIREGNPEQSFTDYHQIFFSGDIVTNQQ